MLDEAVIEVFSSQVCVTSSGFNLEDALLDGKKRHIEGSSSKIEDKHVLLGTLLVKTVGNGSGGRLVDDTKHVKTRDDTGILGSLALGVVEISRDGDDGVLHLATKVSFGDLLHLDENHGRDLLRRKLLGLTLEGDVDDRLAGGALGNLERPVLHVGLYNGIIELAANKTLGIEDSVGSIHSNLVLGGITNQTLSVVESNVRGGGSVTLIVGNNLHTIVLPHTHARVGGTKINTDGCSFNRHYITFFVLDL
mmetsp:Transcript_89975/g.176154  ORF Transcript_89975/g.176154 Transcript_89975/m.176154 type:complete len:251 (-) Transcript_89975:41-793(-)